MRVILLAATLLATGCLGPVLPDDRAVRLDVSRVAAVQDSLRAASGPAWESVVARQLADAGLTPLADGSFRTGLGRSLVGGIVPGREPVARPHLVIVGVGADDPEAATVLEAARLLVGVSKREVAPEQSVLFVLWGNGLDPRRAIEEARRSAVWPRGLVSSVVVAGRVPRGLPVVALDAAGPASVEGVVAQIIEAARRPRPEAVPSP